MVISEKTAVTIDPAQHGLKQYEMKTSTVVFMIFCLCAAGAYGIEEMIPQAGPGLTLAMLIVLPFVWSTPMGLVAAELGSALPQEGGYYKWVQRACDEGLYSARAGSAAELAAHRVLHARAVRYARADAKQIRGSCI